MNRNLEKVNDQEKKRVRDEINTQVEEFLRKGGRIDVLTGRENGKKKMGSVWHNHEDLTLMTD